MLLAGRVRLGLRRAHEMGPKGARGKHYLLYYKYVEGILEKRAPHRPGHLALATELFNKGLLTHAGAHGDATGACFVFDCPDESTVQGFVDNDPYVANGLVPEYSIKEWMLAVGPPGPK